MTRIAIYDIIIDGYNLYELWDYVPPRAEGFHSGSHQMSIHLLTFQRNLKVGHLVRIAIISTFWYIITNPNLLYALRNACEKLFQNHSYNLSFFLNTTHTNTMKYINARYKCRIARQFKDSLHVKTFPSPIHHTKVSAYSVSLPCSALLFTNSSYQQKEKHIIKKHCYKMWSGREDPCAQKYLGSKEEACDNFVLKWFLTTNIFYAFYYRRHSSFKSKKKPMTHKNR